MESVERKVDRNDNLKRMTIPMVSRCWCCANGKENNMNHIFLTAPIAQRLWNFFAHFAGIKVKGLQLHQEIMEL